MEETTSSAKIPERKELCDDILVEILKYLSPSELKSAALVCRQWNNVIGSAAEMMTKFKVNVSTNVNRENCFQSLRKHQHYEFSNVEFDEVKNVLRRFDTSHAKTFAVSNCKEVVECEELMKVLLEMPNLATLELTYMKVNRGDAQNHQTAKFSKLEKLSIGAESFDILPCIEASNLSEVSVHGLRHEFLLATKYEAPQLDNLTTFLKPLKSLKKLIFSGDFFEKARNHFDSINEELSSEVFEMVTSNLKQLTMFCLDSDYQPADPTSYNKIKPVLPLESFRFSGLGILRSCDGRWYTPGYLDLEIICCQDGSLIQIVVIREKYLTLVTIDESFEENPCANFLSLNFTENECSKKKGSNLLLKNAIAALEPSSIMPDLSTSEGKVYRISEDFVQKLGHLNEKGVGLVMTITDRTKLEFTAK